MRQKVFVVFSDGHRDFYKADVFGKVATVMERGYDSMYRDMDIMVDYIKEKMDTYMDGDYLLMVGEPTLCALVTNIALEFSETKILNILRWDKIKLDYIPLRVDFGRVRQSQKDFRL